LGSKPWFSLWRRLKSFSVSSGGPGNQAVTLLKIGRASISTTLNLEPSQAVRVGADLANQSRVSWSWYTMIAAPLDQ
jgi:hypothetical protein